MNPESILSVIPDTARSFRLRVRASGISLSRRQASSVFACPAFAEPGSVFATRPESSYRIFAGVQNLSAIAGQETDNGGRVFYNYWKTGQLGEAFVYKVEGIGEDMLVGNMDFSLVDDIIQIGDGDCFHTGRRLAREEGLFAGGSSGAAVRDLLAARGPRTLISARKMETVEQVIARMKTHGISQLPVEEEGRVIGMIEEVDLLNFMLSGAGFPTSSIEPISHNHCPQVSDGTPLERVSSIFMRSPGEAVLVARESGETDIITKIDLIDYLTKTAPEERMKDEIRKPET